MIPVYKTHIRPILEFSSSVWFTQYIGHLKLLEFPQRRWIKQISGLEYLPYSRHLEILNLYLVRGRHLRSDLIKCWQNFHDQSAIEPLHLFQLPPKPYNMRP
ncbi:hypothetical protein E2C01_047708 [Portunus trituberculatus]|uniref:Uncharacterized protein n=1 Tax=Portunus trituberculatus TaxID=210409 RepID=A0A5B7G9K2_PORTR|nr:hypothetical protein [Portunus trituberculatus]